MLRAQQDACLHAYAPHNGHRGGKSKKDAFRLATAHITIVPAAKTMQFATAPSPPVAAIWPLTVVACAILEPGALAFGKTPHYDCAGAFRVARATETGPIVMWSRVF